MTSSDSEVHSTHSMPIKYVIGKRYLNSRTNQPLTIRYIGPLPPSSVDTPIWIGVEYDDFSHGKHSGTYQGDEVFKCRHEGAGSFLKYAEGVLSYGSTFEEAMTERYGAGRAGGSSSVQDMGASRVILGGSRDEIIVEAPGMAAVQARMGRLERLREVGLEGEWVFELGPGGAELVIRLVGLQMLNLSRNLLSTWSDVAAIITDMPNLRYLSLNFSRLAPILANDKVTDLQEAFKHVEELHLGDSGLTWEELCDVGRVFPRLHTLNLGYNQSLGILSHTSEWANIKELSLEGCHIKSWDEIASSAGRLPVLETLNLSASSSLSSIPSPSAYPSDRFPRLHTLIMLNITIASWSSIDALNKWTDGRLQRLRISLNGIDDMIDRPSDDVLSSATSTIMSGRARLDRPFLIAKLPGLISLNSTPITSAERRDAESYYVRYVTSVISPGDSLDSWGRYESLKGIYGVPVQEPTVRPTSLRSKMITLHVYPAQHSSFDLSVLPSSPSVLLRRKVAKSCGVPPNGVRIWTTRGEDREMVMEVDDAEGKEVGWWFHDGDDVVVDTG